MIYYWNGYGKNMPTTFMLIAYLIVCFFAKWVVFWLLWDFVISPSLINVWHTEISVSLSLVHVIIQLFMTIYLVRQTRKILPFVWLIPSSCVSKVVCSATAFYFWLELAHGHWPPMALTVQMSVFQNPALPDISHVYSKEWNQTQ